MTYNRLMKILKKLSYITGITGVFILALLIILGIKYPHPLFSLLGTIGVILILLSAGLHIFFFFNDATTSVKNRDYTTLILMLIVAGIFIKQIFFSK